MVNAVPSTNPKHHPIPATVKSINSIQAKLSTACFGLSAGTAGGQDLQVGWGHFPCRKLMILEESSSWD